MLLHGLGDLRDPKDFLMVMMAVLIGLSIAITVHEFSHALAAYKLGDSTAQRLGRLSLNPVSHLDPLGTLLLLVVGFGWGKPVPVNGLYLRQPVKWSMAAVSFAGPLANLVTAGVIGAGASLTLRFQPLVLTQLLEYIVVLNVLLAVFNLIPIPPLDGSGIAAAMLPDRMGRYFQSAARFGPLVLLGLLAIDSIAGLGILWRVTGGPVEYLSGVFLGL